MNTIFSGIKPSGNLHIGNYLGAIKQFVELQNSHKEIFCVVDLHAITVPQVPDGLHRQILDVAMMYLAAGIDPKKSLIFVQSHVPAHVELGWILNTFTPVGELQRMTQYKDAIAKGKPPLAGLQNYPTLMAADILLYQTNKVPVGDDQRQHLELTRSIAKRFNNKYGPTFTIPEALVAKETGRIMSLANPLQKMSKSETDPKGTIEILDDPDAIRKKIKEAVTDSGSVIAYDPKQKPAVTNLLSIYSGFSGQSPREVAERYQDKGYAEFKSELSELIIEKLRPIQEKYSGLAKDPKYTLAVLANGAAKASVIAAKTLQAVKEKMGFVI